MIVRISGEAQYRLADGETARLNELEGSDLILPPADLTFVEAGREFTGEGLIPD